MIFLGFQCVCKKVNMFLFYWNKMMLKIDVNVNTSKWCFLWLKLDHGSWVHLPTLS
jgi:hypothetical protein